jgi:hypothetical protein
MFGRRLSQEERSKLIRYLSFDCLVSLGLVHRDRGQMREACSAFREALRVNTGPAAQAEALAQLLNEASQLS